MVVAHQTGHRYQVQQHGPAQRFVQTHVLKLCPTFALPAVFMKGLCVTGGYLVPGYHGDRDDRR